MRTGLNSPASRLPCQGEARNPVNGRALFSVSENGVLVVRIGDLVQNQLIWFDRTGKQLITITKAGNYNAPALSPDEKKVALGRVDFQATTAGHLGYKSGAPSGDTAHL